MRIYKDYELANGTLYKTGMKTNHLLMMQPFNGSPAIDADRVWNKYKDKVERLTFIVEDGQVFSCDKETFELRKSEIDLGFGRQYAMPLEFWKRTKARVEQKVREEKKIQTYQLSFL